MKGVILKQGLDRTNAFGTQTFLSGIHCTEYDVVHLLVAHADIIIDILVASGLIMMK